MTQNGAMSTLLEALLLMSLALGLGAACGGPSETPPQEQPPQPAFPESRAGLDLLGTSVLGDLDVRWPGPPLLEAGEPGPPATLVRFWTDTCPHCRASLPALDALRTKYEPRGFATLGVYHPKPARPSPDETVRAAAEELGYHGALAVDDDWSALKAIWLETGHRGATSVSFLLDSAGRVRFVHPGPEFHASTDADHALCNQDYADLSLAIEHVLAEAE